MDMGVGCPILESKSSWLVVQCAHLEKYEFVNGKDDIPYMKWQIKFMFQTTNQAGKEKHQMERKYPTRWLSHDENRTMKPRREHHSGNKCIFNG